ncbi:hypothetical protein KFK09_001229 [Dendrobium nobile]|uniref:C2 NT-type domain-containing protein n=1 Tax=Dendrobium nobile TaxID=94219 RepID=A0A8T3C6P9_DENNO|nr:hypothetical protein KFK09_001229 [Dendrobium nobile]
MFRLNKHRSERLGERAEFKFSNFQAFKVPKGWDKLYISVISVETGKTIAKSNKATVHSGTCQWTESLSESIPISQDGGLKNRGECFFKFVISMGSVKPAILGEIVLNLADHIDSSDSGPLTLPLNKCGYGTILQVKIQCFNPRTRFRGGNALSATNSRLESPTGSHRDADSKSDSSNTTIYGSVGSFSSSLMMAAAFPNGPAKQDAISLASGSHSSSDSTENSQGTNFSPKNSVNGSSHIVRQDSSDSHASASSSLGPAEGSNPSSFNSRALGSSTPHQWQESTMQAAPHGHASPSLRTSGSAKELLDAAEETIDELRDEAKMWERHAQKLKIDLEKLKRDCSFKSKQQAEMDMELSAANNERDSLKREVDKLKLSVENLKESLAEKEDCKTEGLLHSQRQLEDELKFLRESNNTLTMQLNKSQEANLELVAILEELEETVEKQRLELAGLSQITSISENGEGMRDQTLMDIEAEWSSELSVKEKETSKLEESLHKEKDTPHPMEIVLNQGNSDLVQEIEDLRAKVEELERDCTELTEENLELIYKLKESKKDANKAKEFHSSSSNDFHTPIFLDSSASDISHLKYQICQPEEELQRRDVNGVVCTEPSILQMDEMKKKCAELEIELQYFKNHACDLDMRLNECQVEVEKKKLHSTECQIEAADRGYSDAAAGQGPEIMKSKICEEMPSMLYEMDKQLQLALIHARNLNDGQNTIAENCNEIITDFVVSSRADVTSQERLIEEALIGIIKLSSSLQAKVVECKEFFQNKGEGVREKKMITTTDVHIIEDDIIIKELQSNDLAEELKLRNERLETALLLKEKEIDNLESSIKELEDIVSNIKSEKIQVEESLAVAQRENIISSKCLDDVRNEMIILSSSIDTHLSVNKMLEKKSSELEIGKRELELHISELEVENLQLSERIASLEAQLRYMRDEKETNRLEIEDYKSHLVDLKGEIAQEQAEMETLKAQHIKKLQEVQKRLSEAHEESEVLKRSHSKLESKVESLTAECDLLKKQVGDLRSQKLEMREQMSHLEIELRDLQKKIAGHLNKVEVLEEKLSLLQSDFTLKEETLASQLESIFQDNKEQEQKLSKENVMLKQINQEQMVEVENLKQEIIHLSTQDCSSQDEREKIAADAVREVSILRSNKTKLENNLQEVQSKVKLYETELHNFTRESNNKVAELEKLLNSSKHSEEMLMNDIESMQRMTESVKSSEDTFKRMANELELKLKASNYEKQQITEDVSDLKLQLQKVTQFQNENLNLKFSLEEAKYEREKLEGLLLSTSEECEELKAEKMSFSDKISLLQKSLHDAEDDRRSRVALEEKLLRLEADLASREASYAQEAGMKNEISRIKRVNSEYQRKIQGLEEEKDEIIRKAYELEKELAQRKMERSEEKVSIKVENEQLESMEGPQAQTEAALESKIYLLQIELAEALEANNTYQKQLNGFLSEQQNTKTENSSKIDSGNASKVDPSTKISSLETELKEMRERYLHMSLQYAEVEAQREELVMQLKSAKKDKKWFS